jgi:hypothetical protein
VSHDNGKQLLRIPTRDNLHSDRWVNLYEVFMNLLPKLYGSSYPMMRADREHAWIAIAPIDPDVDGPANHDTVHRWERLLPSLPVRVMQRMQGA